MKKTLALVTTLAFVAMAAPTAEANVKLPKLPNPVELVKKATKAVSNGFKNLVKKANAVGKQALSAASSTMNNLISKVTAMAKKAGNGAKHALFTVADKMVAGLPAFLKTFAKQTVNTGKTFITKLQGQLGGFIDKATQHARDLLGKATGGALKSMAGLSSMLQAKAMQALQLAEKIATGVAKRLPKQIGPIFNAGSGASGKVLDALKASLAKFMKK